MTTEQKKFRLIREAEALYAEAKRLVIVGPEDCDATEHDDRLDFHLAEGSNRLRLANNPQLDITLKSRVELAFEREPLSEEEQVKEIEETYKDFSLADMEKDMERLQSNLNSVIEREKDWEATPTEERNEDDIEQINLDYAYWSLRKRICQELIDDRKHREQAARSLPPPYAGPGKPPVVEFVEALKAFFEPRLKLMATERQVKEVIAAMQDAPPAGNIVGKPPAKKVKTKRLPRDYTAFTLARLQDELASSKTGLGEQKDNLAHDRKRYENEPDPQARIYWGDRVENIEQNIYEKENEIAAIMAAIQSKEA